MCELSESLLKEEEIMMADLAAKDWKDLAEINMRTAQKFEKDRDDWKAIAEMNSDIIDNLRKDVNELLASERDNREKI